MDDVELFKFDGPEPRDASLGVRCKQRVLEVCSSRGETLGPGGGEGPWTGGGEGPWTGGGEGPRTGGGEGPWSGGGEGPWTGGGETLGPGGGEGPWTGIRSAARPEMETETSFICRHGGDGDPVQLRGIQTCNLTHCSSLYEEEDEEEEEEEEEVMEEEEDIPELFLLSDDDLSSSSSSSSSSTSGKSVDYGFILAVTCLVTGISLVIISYTVPREVGLARDSVSAREMEHLERETARVGAHLDRCVIAGLCLLTLGGSLLSSLLMVSMWKGEMMRRKAFAYSKHAANLYGSMSLRAASGLEEEDLEEVLS